ncbi:PadR family transcriptional regulator [Methanocella sp. CWC-04]|uniref:PadR family transcriptional regulator n=1 Tax=Methanooceanicella nereidis TaxID=2052831 RepID=A0AAP2W6C1_9EURY|nr:PadR family transcriptional regulator [Methanocella sp. CWC-04]MCD1295183.1 PadR family transcriptional regulator [Methanocella sp. CWC-04]
MSVTVPTFFENPTRASLNYFVLMLLRNSPKHGYMLMQDIERHTQGKWKPSHSAIYKLLNGLEASGYIFSWEEKDGERARKVYQISEEGLKLLQESEQDFESFINAFISSIVEAERVNPDHLTVLLTKKGKALMNGLDPERRYKILNKLKIFLDTESLRVNRELESLKKTD